MFFFAILTKSALKITNPLLFVLEFFQILVILVDFLTMVSFKFYIKVLRLIINAPVEVFVI
jgi:hypothetical protein